MMIVLDNSANDVQATRLTPASRLVESRAAYPAFAAADGTDDAAAFTADNTAILVSEGGQRSVYGHLKRIKIQAS